MANFLQSSLDAYQRGWHQRYGGGRRPGPMSDPIANNPAIGAPIGAGDDQHKAKAQSKGGAGGKAFKYPTIAEDPGTPGATGLWNLNEGRWLQWKIHALDRINELNQSPDYNTRMNATQAGFAMEKLDNYRDELKKSWEKNPFDPKQTADLDSMRKDINDNIGLIHEPFYPMPVTQITPSSNVASPSPTPSPTPVAQNPAMGQPLGADDGSQQPNYQPSTTALTPNDQMLMLMPWLAALSGGGGAPVSSNPAMGAPLGAPAPISSNPEVGQFDLGGGGGSNPFMQLMMQYMFNRGGGGGPSIFGFGGNQGPYSATTNTPANYFSGGASGGGYETSAPGMGSYYVGASPGAGESGYIYPNQQAATAAGDVGAGSGGASAGPGAAGMIGGGLLSGLGSIVSSFSKQPTFTFNAPNTPLPQRAVFTAPNLSANQNAGF